MHVKARAAHPAYPARSEGYAPSWGEPAAGYSPTVFTHDAVLQNDCTKVDGGWADPVGPPEPLPRNPVGRTGMAGRGLLGKWGANHAADPIVTRRDPASGAVQLIAIRRKDTGDWAIPGGMVDAGESVSMTLKREFAEEAGNVREEEREQFQQLIDELFRPSNARPVYRGYVDDPRNTDNAWMETCAMHFHCSDALAAQLKLAPGDDACDVKWLDCDDRETDYENLYASHKSFVTTALRAAALH